MQLSCAPALQTGFTVNNNQLFLTEWICHFRDQRTLIIFFCAVRGNFLQTGIYKSEGQVYVYENAGREALLSAQEGI